MICTVSALMAVLLGSRLASAHMIMATPIPFNANSQQYNLKPDSAPLAATGANFPCKLNGDAATFYADKPSGPNIMAAGTPQTISFSGSAVHGGGSCQLAITSDLKPTPSSAWMVILSIEGGCPSKDGSGPSTYEYTIPASVPAGNYVFAWTWISKLAGQNEYYMNCAPIQVTAGKGAKKVRDLNELAKRDKLPNLFVANLASINSCKAGQSDVKYPDPAGLVIQPGTSKTFTDPTGTNCWPLGGSAYGAGAVEGGGNTTSGGASSGAGAGSSAVGTTTVATGATTTAGTTTTTSAAAVNGAGVTGGGSSAGASTAASSTAASSTAASGGSAASSAGSSFVYSFAGTISLGGGTTLAGSQTIIGTATLPIGTIPAAAAATTAEASGASSAASSAAGASSAASSAVASGTAATNSTTGSGSAMSGACTSEGMFNCPDGKTYQQCASGAWTVLQAMPAGTSCALGQTSGLWAAGKGRKMRRIL